MNNIIKLSEITKSYETSAGKINVLSDINIELQKKDFTVIMGESGSGKSTLLNIIGGLDYPTSGRINIVGTDITKLPEKKLAYIRNKHIGFIFQNHNLLTDFNAYQNIILPYKIYNKNIKEGEEFAKYLLNEVGLYHRRKHMIGELSGGEQQRIAIARAIINKPDIILADEPTGNLDETKSIAVFDLLKKISDIHNTCIVVVTHSVKLADLYGKKYYLSNHKISNKLP